MTPSNQSIINLMKLHKKIPAYFDQLGFLAICGMALFMAVSRAAFNILFFVLVISYFFSKNFLNFKDDIRRTPISIFSLFLFFWIVASAFYSTASLELAWTQVSSYTKLLIIPLIIIFISTKYRVKYFLVSAVAGLLVLQLAYILDLWIDIPYSHSFETHHVGVFNNYIVEGLSLAMLCLVMFALTTILYFQRNTFFYISLITACIAAYTVFFLNPGRGAQLSLIAGLIIFPLLVFKNTINWKVILLSVITLVFILPQSSMFTSRFVQAFHEFKKANTEVQTSVGLRLNAWRAGIDIWSSSPVIGQGAGSYKKLMFEKYSSNVGGCTNNPVCLQPHSQYILLLSEQGVVGLLIFLGLLASLVLPAFRTQLVSAQLCASFAIAFAIHCLFDSGLRMGTQMFIFVILTSAFYASVKLEWPIGKVPNNYLN